MTPEEEALLKAKLTGYSSGEKAAAGAGGGLLGAVVPGAGLAGGLLQMPEFTSRVVGSASRLVPKALDAMSPGVQMGRAAGSALRDVISPTPQGTGEIQPPSDLPAGSASPSLLPAAPSVQLPTSLRSTTPGGGGGGGGSDYGSKLKQGFLDAQKREVGTFDTQKGLHGELGQQKFDEANQLASLGEAEAARHAQDASDEQQAHAAAKAQTDAAMAKQQQMAADIAATKPDLGRLFRNKSHAERVGWGVASALDGWLAGMNHRGGNDTLDRLDKMMDRDIDAQVQEMNNKKTALSAQQTLVGQLMQQSGNEAVARQQARSLMWDAVKSYMGAQAQRIGSPQLLTNAKLASADIDQKQSVLQTQIAKDLYDTNLKQAAAAAAAQHAAALKQQERLNKLTDEFVKGDAQNAPMSPDQARAAAMATVHGEGAVRGAGYVGPLAPSQRAAPGAEKDERAMTVVINGKEHKALSTEAAQEWRKFSDGRRNFEQSLKDMRDAAQAGDPARYNTARGILLDTAPKLLGFSRGPSEGQLQTTFGPMVVPEYNHWYNPTNVATAGVAYPVKQERNSRQLDVLQELLDNSSHTMVENTVGAPAMPDSVKPKK